VHDAIVSGGPDSGMSTSAQILRARTAVPLAFTSMGKQARVTGVRVQLWRAAVAYRVATLLVVAYLVLRWQHLYRDASIAGLALAGMSVVTAAIAWLGLTGRANRITIVAADMLATAGLTVLSISAQTSAQRHGGMPTLTTFWAAGPALEAGIVLGALAGVLAGAVQLCAAMLVRDGYDGRTLGSAVLLVVAGGVTGYVTVQLVRTERLLVEATAAQAALRERERLARTVHDGVLQLLALVQRKAGDGAADWGALATDAAAQEARLRALMRASNGRAEAAGSTDLAASLRLLDGDRVTVSAPAHPVVARSTTAEEIRAAVLAALDNATKHAGPNARAWVLLEDLAGTVRVTVRDDGAGMAPGTLEDATGRGRLGVVSSIRSRIHELGGDVRIDSAPGNGTTVTMTVPIEPR
jgi:signal transduction histidine kinase